MKRILHHVHRHVHKVRSQPEAVKRRILHAATAVSGVLLIFLWILGLGIAYNGSPDTQTEKKSAGPLTALKDNLVGGYINLSAAVPESLEE